MLQVGLFTTPVGDEMNSDDNFANYLKREMYDRGINQTTLARMSGLTPGAISNILRHQRKQPSTDTCKKLAAGLQKVGWQGEVEDLLRMAGHTEALPAGAENEAHYVKIKEIMMKYKTTEQRELLIEFAGLLLRRQ
jgi:transcriptional regulator with XRE-family HTH domain